MANARDWKKITDKKSKYAAYLCSREWAEKREAVRKRAKNTCERCRLYKMDACHHLTYERQFDELLEDLQAICKGCHEFTHGKSNVDPLSHSPFARYVASVAAHYGSKRRPVGYEYVMDLYTEIHNDPEASAVMMLDEQYRREVSSVAYHSMTTGCDIEPDESIASGYRRCAELIQEKFLSIALIEWLDFGRPAGIGWEEYQTLLEAHGYTFPVPHTTRES